MNPFKRFKLEDGDDDQENKRVWDRLDGLEKDQKNLSRRLTQVELKSGIYSRRKPSGGSA